MERSRGNSYWYGDIRNPIGTLYTNDNQTKGYNFLANISAEVTLFPWLRFKSTFGYDAKMWYNDNFSQAYDYSPTPVEETTRYQDTNKSFTYLWDNFYFTFEHTFADKHDVNLMVGKTAQWNRTDAFNATMAGFLFDSVHEFDNGTTMKDIGGSSSDWALLSFMARPELHLRRPVPRDGHLPPRRLLALRARSPLGQLPSVSAAWRISRERWFPQDSFVSDLSPRRIRNHR